MLGYRSGSVRNEPRPIDGQAVATTTMDMACRSCAVNNKTPDRQARAPSRCQSTMNEASGLNLLLGLVLIKQREPSRVQWCQWMRLALWQVSDDDSK
jgi:hypothetical protein